MSISQIKSLVNDYITQNGFDLAPRELYEPLDYIMGIGGKRLRPLTLLLVHEMFGGDVQSALPAAYGIELFHNFSLIHDDIMDDASLRRGNRTVHEKWDLNTGILSGDAMLIYSYRYLNQACTSSSAVAVNKIFSDTAIKVCEGQQMDVNFENRQDVEQMEYVDMIYKKTGALIEGAMMIGARLADASDDGIRSIGQFAKQIGISFQLQDDILDAFGESAQVGKRIGGDILQNKKTILYILAMQSADANDQKLLESLFTDRTIGDEEKIEQVMDIFGRLSVQERAAAIRDDYHKAAFSALDEIKLPTEKKQPLVDFVDLLLERQF